MLLTPWECTVTIKILLLSQNSSFITAIKSYILGYECYLLSLSNLAATQGCQPFKSSNIENWQARDDRWRQNAYDFVCDDAIWCHFLKKNSLTLINVCTTGTVCSYLAACTNDKYHKKQQILVIIPKISDSKLETGKYGPKPGVSGLSGRVDSSGHEQYSKEYLNQSHQVDLINTRAKE